MSMKNVLWVNPYMSVSGQYDVMGKVYARYFPKDPPARGFVCVLPWHGPFDVEIDCVARV